MALVRAVQAGGPHCIDVLNLLLQHGALLDAQDYDGRTALHQVGTLVAWPGGCIGCIGCLAVWANSAAFMHKAAIECQ